MNSATREVDDGLGIGGAIRVQEYAVSEVRGAVDGWDALSDSERLTALSDVEADRSVTTRNIALDRFLERLASGLDPTETIDISISHLAVGTDRSDDPDPSSISLNREVYRTFVGDAQPDPGAQNGADLITSTLLSQNEANGREIVEVGLADGSSGSLLTHALLDEGDSVDKNSSMVVTFDYVVEFRRAD